MTALGSMALGDRTKERVINREHLYYSDDANVATWNDGSMLIPTDIEHAMLTGAFFRTVNAATIHTPDYSSGNGGECVMLNICRGQDVSSNQIRLVSRPIAAVGIATNGDWGAAFDIISPQYVTGGDLVFYEAPPADDGGAPTGDYQCFLQLDNVRYFKS